MDAVDGSISGNITDRHPHKFVGLHRRRGGAAALAAFLLSLAASQVGAQAVPTSTLVNFSTNAGSFQVDLFDQVTPLTAANFLSYVNSNAYQNTIVHRSVPNFVIQSGGYKTSQFTQSPLPLAPEHITESPSVLNEFRLTNAAGTISMAKSGGNPNSAKSEWFINLQNNAGSPPLGLDFQNGGFTVFGHVMNPGMNVVSTIGNPSVFVPTLVPFPGVVHNPPSNPSPYATVPKDSSGNFVNVSNISVVRTHPAFQNPNNLLDVNNDGIISPADAVAVINNLVLANGIHSASQYTDTRYRYVDTSGNGLISPVDAIKVINHLILQAQQAQSLASPLSFSPSVSPSASVPEPSSWALGIIGALALTGYALRRRHSRRAGLRLAGA